LSGPRGPAMKTWRTLPPGDRGLWIAGAAVIGLTWLAGTSALLLFVVLPALHLGRVFWVPNQGMKPTVTRPDYVFADELAFVEARPVRGEVVSFRGEDLPTLVHRFVWQTKRIVGVPGDVISIRGGTLYVGDRPAPELTRFHYIPMEYANYLRFDGATFTVPPGTYFVLGDFPQGSYDSRAFGPVPGADIRGKLLFRIWPPSRIGPIR
jgi:signal peptidase I